MLAGLGSPVRFRKEKSCCSVLIRRAPAPTHTHTLTHIHPHTHTPTDTHSYTQCGHKPYATCARDHMHIHTHQVQLMPTSRSRSVLVVSPRHVVSRVCILLNISSYIAGRRYPNSISLKFGLNHTCGVLRSFIISLRHTLRTHADPLREGSRGQPCRKQRQHYL